jgi:hypothetical protein
MVVRGIVMPDKPLPQAAADLLTDWRVAERGLHEAKVAQVQARAVVAAAEATEEAAGAAQMAAAAALEAALAARAAANRAGKAADHASEESQIQTSTAQGDVARANQAVDVAAKAEAVAHERFRRSQNGGMDEDRWAPSTSPSQWVETEP